MFLMKSELFAHHIEEFKSANEAALRHYFKIKFTKYSLLLFYRNLITVVAGTAVMPSGRHDSSARWNHTVGHVEIAERI